MPAQYTGLQASLSPATRWAYPDRCTAAMLGHVVPAKNAIPNQATTTSGPGTTQVQWAGSCRRTGSENQAGPVRELDNPQTLNLYAYVRNNPLGGVDANGHCGGYNPQTGQMYCPPDTKHGPAFIGAAPQQSGFGGAGAGGSWDPAPTTQTSTASSTPSRVNRPGYGGSVTVSAGAGAALATETSGIGASIPEEPLIPFVNTPFGPAYQGTSEAELGGLADAQGGAMLYRSGITGFNSATEGQYLVHDESSNYRRLCRPYGYAFTESGRKVIPSSSLLA